MRPTTIRPSSPTSRHIWADGFLEVGAGIGTFSRLLAHYLGITELNLLEPAENNHSILRERFAADPRVRVVHGYLEERTDEFAVDTMVPVNVLDHVADDRKFLEVARSVLHPGGTLALFVPTVPAIYGTLDTEFDHHRRYTHESLGSQLNAAGFAIRALRYVKLPGVMFWFLLGRVLRRTTLRPRDVRLYDRWVIPWVMKLERSWSPPLGQSLLAIGKA